MPIQTRMQAQQNKQTLPSTSQKMVKEVDNRDATDEIEQLIEKELAHQRTEMFAQFSAILMRVTSNSEESFSWPHSDKIIPFKVQMNLDILNLEGKIDVESLNNWNLNLQ